MAWDKTKPATNSALASAEMRANFAAIETAFGPPDAATLQQVATNFLGAVTFVAPPTFKPGGVATFDGTIGGVLSASMNVTSVNNGASAAEVDLMSYAIPASLLNADKKILKITSLGTFTSSANTKRVKAKWGPGPTTLFDTNADYNDSVTHSWILETFILRTGAATQLVTCRWLDVNAATGNITSATPGLKGALVSTDTQTLSNSLTFKLTGQCGAAANNIQQNAQWMEVIG